ncbi:MAG: DNA polymerase LigD [Chitinophagaceae bacterium]|nr:MAG: DNA polymerase LigD [Chitinophagaceae bacterium]
MAKAQIAKIGGRELTLTNQDKIYFPKEKVTKGDVLKYYQMVYKFISPYLKDRPQSLRRNPDGIKNGGFFHKDAGDLAPSWMKTFKINSEAAGKKIDYLICNEKATLAFMNNLGCIEINPWNSSLGSINKPDYMIMDIDPSDKNTFDEVIQTALVIKKLLDKAGAKSYCKTSGSTGLHIYIPLHAQYTYTQIRSFAKGLAVLTQKELPEITTVERPLNKRKGRIYIDYLQNRRGQTLACAYSLRPKPGATVSAPLEWKEVKKGLKISDFHIGNILKRLEKKGDLFKGVLKGKTDLKKCAKKLGIRQSS